jgi:uncharacterized protein (DUF58 family)
MIVPRSRLLFWVAAVVLPCALLAAVPETRLLAACLAGLFAVAVGVDAIGGRNGLAGIGVSLPPVIRLSKDRASQLELEIRNATKQPLELRLGLAFPQEIASPQEDLWAQLPGEAEFSRVQWPCTPRARGSFFLERCYLECPSPWGLWSVRGSCASPAEVRVYPNLMTERSSVAALFLNRGNFGAHALRQVGKGRDFEKLREYIPGDGYDEIHWKATAKRGRPVTKIFQIERTQEVYVIIDASRLTARKVTAPSTGPDEEPVVTTTLERYLTAALVLGLAAEQQGDLFGLLTFNDKVQKFVRAKNGKAHYAACRDALYALQPQSVSPDFDELCSFIRLRLRRRALLFFLTSLDDPVLAESFTRNMELICRQHLILVNMMQPPGSRPLFTNPRVESYDDLYRELGGHVRWHNLRELEKVLKNRGVHFAQLDNARLSAQLVTQYLGVKQRQSL